MGGDRSNFLGSSSAKRIRKKDFVRQFPKGCQREGPEKLPGRPAGIYREVSGLTKGGRIRAAKGGTETGNLLGCSCQERIGDVPW